MKPTQEPDNAPTAPAIQRDLITPMQAFGILLARYKARVYEIYGHEIGRSGETNAFIRPRPANEKKAE